MSFSVQQRKENISIALLLMMQGLGEPYDRQMHEAKCETFKDVYRTTWEELAERDWVQDGGFDRYWLKGPGWIAGLKVTGLFLAPEFREKAGLLSKALKARVKNGRKWGHASRTELAAETGLSEFFIYDAIDSHLLLEMFNRTDAYWSEGYQKNYIEIPPRFGLPLLSS